MASQDNDVIVIGGGLSGLAAASYLVKCGLQPVVLEARERVGGRTVSDTITAPGPDGPTSFLSDLGGAYVGATQDRILRVADELLVATYPVHLTGKNVLMLHGSRVAHKGTIPPLPPVALLDLNTLMLETERLVAKVPKDAFSPDTALPPLCLELDRMTVEQWAKKKSFSPASAELYCGAVKSVLTTHPAAVSMLFWVKYVQQAGGLELLMEHAQAYKFVGGSQSISEKLAARLGGGVVYLNQPVRRITWEDTGVTVTTRAGRSWRAPFVVMAMAPSMYGGLEFEPPLPSARLKLCQRMPMGSIIKTVTVYRTAWWRDTGFSGSVFHDAGPVLYSYDDSGPDAAHPAIMGFILADHAMDWVRESKDRREAAVVAQYAAAFGNDAALAPVAFHERNWMGEEFSGGCYTGVMGPRVLTECGRIIAQPMGRIHFAGTETASEWPGYMEGAVQAGERAAHEVAARFVSELAERGDGRTLSVPAAPPGAEPANTTIPHPTSLRPGVVDKLLPTVPTFYALLSVAAAVATVAVIRWLK